MSAYAGPLVPVTSPYVALDRLPLVLLLGALIIAWSGQRLEPRRRHAVALVSIGMALGLLAVHVAHLVMLDPARRALRDVTTNLVRIGSFDANLGWFLDPTSAFLLLVPLVGSAFFLARTKFVKKDDTARRFQSGVLLLCTGVSTALLADGFVLLLMGKSLAMVATYLLIVRDQRLSAPVATAHRLFMLQSAGSAAFLAGFVLLFWSLGGAWRDDGYLSDYRARFVAVHAPGHKPDANDVVVPGDAPRGERDAAAVARKAKAQGSLTFTSHPGARVFVDTGDKNLDRAEPFAAAPFVRKELSAGPHEVQIVPGGAAIVAGDGHEVAWIERLVVDVGEDVSIVPLGQTTTFSEVEDQLGLVDDEGRHFVRNAVFNRTLRGSLGVVPLLVFLAALGALLVGAPVLLVPWFARISPSPAWNVASISAVVLAIYPLVRLRSFVSFHLDLVAALFLVAVMIVMLVRSRRPSLIVGAATIALFASPSVTKADDGECMVLLTELGKAVELQYAPDGETMYGEFVIQNKCSGSKTVTHASMNPHEHVPRIPPFVTAEIEGAKGQPVVLEPGKQRRVVVRWKYSATRAREFHGLAGVYLSDGRLGRLVPVHAARPRDLGPWGDRALSFIVGFPLVGVLLALVLRVLRRDTPRNLAVASALVFAANVAFVLAICVRFDNQFSRADGNDGLQFVERSVWLNYAGIEWFLGLDGLSLTLVLMTSIAGLLAAIASTHLRDRAVWFHLLAPVVVSSAVGVFVAQDIFFVCLFWLIGAFAATGLVASRSKNEAYRFGALALAGTVFLGASAYWLYSHSNPTYLVNGEIVVKTCGLPDLSRVDWVDLDWGYLFGARGIVIVWSALFVAFVLRLVTLKSVLAEMDTPTNMLLPAASVGTGIYGLLRLNVGMMPAGTRWAATTVIVLGIVMIFVFASLARLQTNVKSWLAHAATAYAGFALVGIGSCTPQGIAAAVHVAVSLMLGIGLLAMLAQALDTRAGTHDGGLSKGVPLFTGTFLIAVFVLVGLPGLAGFWGPLLAIVGVFPRQPLLGVWAIVAFVVLCAVGMRINGRMLFGAVDEKRRKSQWADLQWDELLVLVPLVVIAVGLGISPRTLFSLLDSVILDLHRLVDAAGAMQVG